MKNILVTKMDGTLQPYDAGKVIRSVMATGLDLAVAQKVAGNITSKLYNRIPTPELYRLVAKEVKVLGSPKHHSLYRLREALSEMDSLKFEEYLTEVLRAHGYQTEWNRLIKGAAVEHQVDVLAKKGAEFWLVEIKHHVDWHKMSGLGNVLQVQARLEDIQEGFKLGRNKFNFTGAWLINNTKFSEHAKQYAAYRKLRLSGWHYSDLATNTLENLIQQKAFYPITILNISDSAKKVLQMNNLVTVNDLLSARRPVKMSYSWPDLIKQAQAVLSDNLA